MGEVGGYNPNRGRSFIFANIKISPYDTASSRYQREMKEYQMKALLKGENAWEAILSRKSMGSLYFLRRLNYAFDFQKHEMFQYYKDQREEAYRRMAEETQGAEPEDEDDET